MTHSQNKYIGNWTSYSGPPEVTHASQSAGWVFSCSFWLESFKTSGSSLKPDYAWSFIKIIPVSDLQR